MGRVAASGSEIRQTSLPYARGQPSRNVGRDVSSVRRRLAAALALLAALAVGIDVADGLRSGSALGVAYVTGSATSPPVVWLAGLDGSHPRRLGGGSYPLLAPNGSLVAASSTSGLILYPASGGTPHRYLIADASASAVAFSPDSRYLAVVLSSTNPASVGSAGLAVIDTTTYVLRMLVRGQIYGASFAPDGSDRIAFGFARSLALSARVDVDVTGADGSRLVQITHGGRSLNPVWGRRGIAFDHEQLRAHAEPAYQVWLMASDGSSGRALTRLPIPPLRDGLVPIAFSDAGDRLLAQYEGQDTSEAWVLTLASGRAVSLGFDFAGGAISRDGTRVLVDHGGFLNPATQGVVESLPLSGGRPRVLAVHGSEPSWNA